MPKTTRRKLLLKWDVKNIAPDKFNVWKYCIFWLSIASACASVTYAPNRWSTTTNCRLSRGGRTRTGAGHPGHLVQHLNFSRPKIESWPQIAIIIIIVFRINRCFAKMKRRRNLQFYRHAVLEVGALAYLRNLQVRYAFTLRRGPNFETVGVCTCYPLRSVISFKAHLNGLPVIVDFWIILKSKDLSEQRFDIVNNNSSVKIQIIRNVLFC